MLRLDCYTAATLALSRQQEDTPPLLSCVLQHGAPGAQQHLAVWVGGVRQPLTRDGERDICTWQCAPEVEMEIRLDQHHQMSKAWRGWWRKGAIVHVGTLPLQVFLEGQEQPAASAAALSASMPPLRESATLDQRNGTSALHPQAAASATSVVERPAVQADQLSASEETTEEEEQDLWDMDLAAMRQAAAQGQEEEAEAVAAPPVDSHVAHDSSQAETMGESAEIVTAPMIAAMGARAAGSRAEQERMLEQLAVLLADMPPKTILVDLRQHARTPRVHSSRRASPRPGATLGLTKETLRGLYGARYWERGGGIPTTLRQVSTRPARWHLMISDPQAEGLQELLAQLAAGVSLLILDGEATYPGSKRAAVIDFVREQCPQVTIGACF